MQFTGKNLKLVHKAVLLAINDIHTQTGSCPDVIEYSDEIEELEQEEIELELLLARIEIRLSKSIEKSKL